MTKIVKTSEAKSSIDMLTQFVNTRVVENEKELRVLEAAKKVFLRYGFRRVTMQDIADEAGISRPALYPIFANKEEVFLAAIRNMTDGSMRTIREGLAVDGTVEWKLQFAFEVWTVQPFELMLASPDARELIECVQGFAKETFQRISAKFEDLLIEILEPLVRDSGSIATGDAELDVQLDAGQIAHLLAASTHGFKDSAASVEELRAMVSRLISLIVAALRAKADSPGNDRKKSKSNNTRRKALHPLEGRRSGWKTAVEPT